MIVRPLPASSKDPTDSVKDEDVTELINEPIAMFTFLRCKKPPYGGRVTKQLLVK